MKSLIDKVLFLSFVAAPLFLSIASPASAQPGTIVGLDGKCMDVLEAGTEDGTPVVLFRCTGAPNQQWSVEQVGAQVRVRGLANKCLLSADPATSLSPSSIGSCDAPEALFNLSGWFPESFSLIQRDSGLCVDVLGNVSDDLTPIVFFACTGNENQVWRFRPSAIGGPPVQQTGDLFGIGDQCLDVLGASTEDGTPAVMFPCSGSANQAWTFEPAGGRLRIRGLGDRCLRPGGVGTSGFDEIVIGSCEDDGALWDIAQAGAAPSFGLLHVDSGQCLDVLGASTDPLTPIILFPCRASANQTFRFDPRPVAGRCIPSSARLCLNDGRFAVEGSWRDFGNRVGPARAQPINSIDSGLMWFFQPDNLEVLVKVLDNCGGTTNRFWVFAAATTNVEYTLRVTDTETGQVRTYFNPLGTRSPAITDTNAFDTCP